MNSESETKLSNLQLKTEVTMFRLTRVVSADPDDKTTWPLQVCADRVTKGGARGTVADIDKFLEQLPSDHKCHPLVGDLEKIRSELSDLISVPRM